MRRTRAGGDHRRRGPHSESPPFSIPAVHDTIRLSTNGASQRARRERRPPSLTHKSQQAHNTRSKAPFLPSPFQNWGGSPSSCELLKRKISVPLALQTHPHTICQINSRFKSHSEITSFQSNALGDLHLAALWRVVFGPGREPCVPAAAHSSA